jgi:IS30 family transposase
MMGGIERGGPTKERTPSVSIRAATASLGRRGGALREVWSPEQVASYLRRRGELRISHDTIYRHVWGD